MKYAIYNADGEILRVGMCAEDMLERQIVAPGERLYRGEASLFDMIDPATGQRIPNGKPAQPSPEHDWDPRIRRWVVNLARYKAKARALIEAERDRRITAVITYDGKRLDADPASLDRIGKKLAAIAAVEGRAESVPELALVWRDHDNITHAFPDLATYKSWLQGLTVALDARGTAAFAWSWATKSQLDAVTTVGQVDDILSSF